MNAPDITQGCHCMPDCEFHSYDYQAIITNLACSQITITVCPPIQIVTQALDVEELCTFSEVQKNPEMDMVLLELNNTNIPLSHWYNAVMKVKRRKRMRK